MSDPDQHAVEEAALATHRAAHGGTDTRPATGTDDETGTDTQGDAARGDDVTPDGDVTEPLGGVSSGEQDYVAVNPAGESGDPTAGLTADDEDGRGESGPEPGAQVGGSSGR